MDKKLPGVFVNRINKKLSNNESVFYEKKNINFDSLVNNKLNKDTSKTVNEKINSIFTSNEYVYKMEVIIKLKDKTLTKKIIGRNKNELITIEGEVISIDDVIDIYPKNKPV